jgi:hypothetical protein
MENKLEIVERSSGFWITDGSGTIEGSFNTLKEAQECLTSLEKAIHYDGWSARLNGKTLTISKDGIEREYTISQKNDGIEYDKTCPEYFYIRTKKFYYNFKFEEGNFFVGDKFTNDNEHAGEFAAHVFGE